MDFTLKVSILVLGIVFDGAVFFLLVTRRINERNFLPWIAGTLIIMIFSLIPSALSVMANFLGVDYPPALLFLIAILVILILLLYQSIHISLLQNKCQELAQNLAILNRPRIFELQESELDVIVTEENYLGKGSSKVTPCHSDNFVL